MTISEAIERVQRKPQVVEPAAPDKEDSELIEVGIGHLRNTGAVDMFSELQQILAGNPESADVSWDNGYGVFGDKPTYFDLTPEKRVRMSLQWGFDQDSQTCNVVQVMADTHPIGSIYVQGINRELSLTVRKVGNMGGKEKLEDAIAQAYLAPARMKGIKPPVHA